MAYGKRLAFETIREAAFGAIGANFAAIGPVTVDNTRIFTVFNTTDVDVYISIDGVNPHLRCPAGVHRVLDVTTNAVSQEGLFLSLETQFYQKQTSMGAPSSGSIWIEVGYAAGGV